MQRGHTMFELLVVLAVAATLSGVSVPGLAWVQGRSAVKTDAQRLALVLRRAQARAAPPATRSACGSTARAGATSASSPVPPARPRRERRFHGPCATNYPGAAVDSAWGVALRAAPASRGPAASSSPATAPSRRSCLQMGGGSDGARRPPTRHPGPGERGMTLIEVVVATAVVDDRGDRRLERPRRRRPATARAGGRESAEAERGRRARGAAQPAVRGRRYPQPADVVSRVFPMPTPVAARPTPPSPPSRGPAALRRRSSRSTRSPAGA